MTPTSHCRCALRGRPCRRPLAAVALAAAWFGASTLAHPAAADTYVLDKEHTEVRVVWEHLGLTRQSARFRDVDGTVEFDAADPEAGKVAVTIKVASITSGVASLDKLLVQSRDYFDVERHPTITFKSTAVAKTGAKTGDVTGDLTINGITRPAVLQVTWNFTGEHPLARFNPTFKDKTVSAFSATAVIRRGDWGITRFAPLVSDELQIGIEAEMLKK